MQFNTINFTNIDLDVFVGRFEGEDYTVQPGETRYFPSHVSQHFSKQLMDKLFLAAQRKDKKANKVELEQELIRQILGGEINTFSPDIPKTTKQQILGHETAVKVMFAEEEKRKQAEKIEAMKITEEQ